MLNGEVRVEVGVQICVFLYPFFLGNWALNDCCRIELKIHPK
jgi:hypothetical protein